MGNFYTNVTLVGTAADTAVARLRELGRSGYVAAEGADCVVYDRECERQDTDVLMALADDRSSSLNTRALAVLNHDDDILWFQLYDRGQLVAEYANRGGPRTNVRALCAALGRPAQTLRVWFLLARPFVCQLTRHARLVQALGLPEAAVGTGCTYIDQDEPPIGVPPERILRV